RLGATAPADLVPALVNGTAGAIVVRGGRPSVVMAFTVADGKIREIDVVADPDRVGRLVGAALGPP
ncbi:MAG: RNA polymerase subunit sigma-70, partial [Acidobacteriota bacterium]|nr:RNA polymerase subunit sigma-70 [Acidobacteriota bacterium]